MAIPAYSLDKCRELLELDPVGMERLFRISQGLPVSPHGGPRHGASPMKGKKWDAARYKRFYEKKYGKAAMEATA